MLCAFSWWLIGGPEWPSVTLCEQTIVETRITDDRPVQPLYILPMFPFRACLVWWMRWSIIFSLLVFGLWNGMSWFHHHLIPNNLIISISMSNGLIPPKFIGWTHDTSPYEARGDSTNQTHHYSLHPFFGCTPVTPQMRPFNNHTNHNPCSLP
jgi:hypothetical protein